MSLDSKFIPRYFDELNSGKLYSLYLSVMVDGLVDIVKGLNTVFLGLTLILLQTAHRRMFHSTRCIAYSRWVFLLVVFYTMMSSAYNK